MFSGGVVVPNTVGSSYCKDSCPSGCGKLNKILRLLYALFIATQDLCYSNLRLLYALFIATKIFVTQTGHSKKVMHTLIINFLK